MVNWQTVKFRIGYVIFVFIMIVIATISIYAVYTASYKIHDAIYSKCCMCGVITNDCCPCPNIQWFNIVEEWASYDASGAGSWHMMCIDYQKATNITFDCFE